MTYFYFFVLIKFLLYVPVLQYYSKIQLQLHTCTCVVLFESSIWILDCTVYSDTSAKNLYHMRALRKLEYTYSIIHVRTVNALLSRQMEGFKNEV